MNSGVVCIGVPCISEDERQATLATTVTCGKEKRLLWYSLPAEKISWFSADRCDGLLVALLFYAMERNADLAVEGPVSSRLLHNLQTFFIPMMAQAFRRLHRINIHAGAVSDDGASGMGVCTGFSGGIDSCATVIQHYVKEACPRFRITDLLFCNVGAHGQGAATSLRTRALFRQRFKMVLPFANEIGLPITMVDSNVSEAFPTDFILTHSALNAAVPLLLQNRFQRYYYSSAYRYADCGVRGTDDIAHFDPLAVHLLSTEGLDCVSTGCEMSRVEKTRMVGVFEPSYRFLNVCVDPRDDGGNCSVCSKCCRTIVTLELLGLEQLYRGVFDLQKFARVRSRYVNRLLAFRRGWFEAEIAELYAQRATGVLGVAFKARQWLEGFRGRA